VLGIFLPLSVRTWLPSFLEQPQVVGTFVTARVARRMDRIAGVGLGPILIFLDLEVVTQIVDVHIPVDDQPSCEILQPRYP
jgi:hypothetical protein